MDIQIELLKKPGKHAVKGEIYDEDSFRRLEARFLQKTEDPWHVPVKIRSRYAAIDDIKTYVSAREPTFTGNWSFHREYDGSADIRWGDGKYLRLPPETMQELTREHIDERTVVLPVKEWSFRCGRSEWPNDFPCGEPIRVTATALAAIRKQLTAYLSEMDADDLASGMDDIEYGYSTVPQGRLLVMAMAAMEMAKKTSSTAFMYTY